MWFRNFETLHTLDGGSQLAPFHCPESVLEIGTISMGTARTRGSSVWSESKIQLKGLTTHESTCRQVGIRSTIYEQQPSHVGY